MASLRFRFFRYCRIDARAFAVTTKSTLAGLPAALRRDDLDGLAVAQRCAQRHEAAIDLGRHAAIADVGVHGIREIDAGRIARQTADLALRREHVHLVREQVDPDALEEFLGVAALLDFDQLLQPLARAIALDAGPGCRRRPCTASAW